MTTTQPSSRCDQALTVRTSLQLGANDLLQLRLQPGDSLRGEHGTAWITIDGQLRDILLEPGQEHRVAHVGALNLSALGSACVSVLGHVPLAWRRITPAGASRASQWRARWGLGAPTALGGGPGFYNPNSAASAAGR